MITTLSLRIRKEQRIFYRVLPFLLLLVLAKLAVHRFDLEWLSLNAIFSGIIGATVFLMGFLLSGVLSDFKESERIPGELAAILATLADEFQSIHCRTGSPLALAALEHVQGLGTDIHQWLHRQQRNGQVMARLAGLNHHYLAVESLTQATFIARLKQEQSALRKLIIRIHTIRETSFISSGYFIASSTTILLLVGLLFTRIEPFHEALFFVTVVSYLLLFLMFLIRDLDNPFGHSDQASSEDVSLKPLENALADLQARVERERSRREGLADASSPTWHPETSVF